MSIDEKYIIVLGETGSGKSTFINYLANYFHRGNLDCPKIAIPNRFYDANMGFVHDEQGVTDVTKSQTGKCNEYMFKLESVNFHFVDTPGINDMGGLLQDSRNLDKIFDYIQQIPAIDAFILVMNGALPRLTVNIRHVLSTIKERIPDVMYENMLVILTNCYSHAVNFQPNAIGLSNECPVFYMQNSAFCSDSRSWPPQTQEQFEKEFKSSMTTINSIIDSLCKLESQSTITFKNMSGNRNMLKRELHNARLALMDLQRLEDELSSIALTSNLHIVNMEKFQNYIQQKKITRTIQYTTPYYNTTCSKCHFVCHEKCGLEEISKTGNKTFSKCKAMKNGTCTICPRYCKARDHYHDRSMLHTEMTTIKKVISGLEERYSEAVRGKSNADMQCKNIQEAKKMIELELEQQYNKVKENVRHLQTTCSGFNVAEELFDFIVDLKKDISALKSKSVIEKANAFVSTLELLCNTTEQTLSSSTEQNQELTISPMKDSYNMFKPIDTLSADNSTNPPPKVTVRKSIESPQQRNYHESDWSKVVVGRAHSVFNRQDSSNHVEETKEMDVDNNEQVNGELRALPAPQIPTDTRAKAETPSIVDAENKLENFKAYTLNELIEASRENKSKQIRKELSNRCLGKSIGLLTNKEHFNFCEQFVELRPKQLRELVLIRETLMEEIRDQTDDDPFNIDNVDKMKFLRLVAANLLMSYTKS